MCRSLVLLWTGVLSVHGAALQAQVSPQGDLSGEELAAFVLAGWKSERERVVSGIVRIYGQCDYNTNLGVEAPFNTFDVTYSFDSSQSAERFDIVSYNGGRGAWLRLADRKVAWQDGDGTVVTIDSPHVRLAEGFANCDIRQLPLGGVSKLSDDSAFSGLVDLLEGADLAVERIEPSKYRLSFALPVSGEYSIEHNATRCSLVIDELRGYAVESHRIGHWASKEFLEEHAIPESLLQLQSVETETEWVEKESVWVPTRIESADGDGSRKMSVMLDWQSLNEPLDAGIFDVQRIGAPDGTYVVDNRLSPGEGVIVGKIGDRDYVHAAQMPAAASHPLEPKDLSRRTWWLLGTNVVGGIAIVCLVWYRRRSSR